MFFFIKETRQLSDRHSVAHRNRVVRRESKFVGVGDWSFNIDPVDWIWPIENKEWQLGPGRFFHYISECCSVGVETCPDVLNVINQRVEVFELLWLWTARLSEKRIDGQAGLIVFGV